MRKNYKSKKELCFYYDKLYIFISLILLNITMAYADVSYNDNKIYGCDNNKFCSLIIIKKTNEKDNDTTSVVDNPNWYIKYDWNSDKSFSLHLNFLDYRRNNPKLFLITGENKKINVDLNYDGNAFYGKIDGYSINNFKSFTLTYDNKTFTDEMSLPVNINENSVSKQNNETYYARKWYDRYKLTKKETAILLKRYVKDADEYCYNSDNNFTFKIDNIGEFFVLCGDTGYNYSVTLWKKLNGKLEPYNFENDTSDIGLDGWVSNNNINGFSLAQDDPYKFYVSIKGRHTGDCGAVLTFIFDGERFRLVRDEEMPICANIYDWIKSYDVPFKKYR